MRCGTPRTSHERAAACPTKSGLGRRACRPPTTWRLSGKRSKIASRPARHRRDRSPDRPLHCRPLRRRRLTGSVGLGDLPGRFPRAADHGAGAAAGVDAEARCLPSLADHFIYVLQGSARFYKVLLGSCRVRQDRGLQGNLSNVAELGNAKSSATLRIAWRSRCPRRRQVTFAGSDRTNPTMARSTADVRRLILIGLIVSAAYVLAAKVGFRVAFVAEQVTTVWAPTGIAEAALIFWGRSLWPAIWLGAFAANADASAPLWIAAALATGNTLEAVAAASLLRRSLPSIPPCGGCATRLSSSSWRMRQR